MTGLDGMEPMSELDPRGPAEFKTVRLEPPPRRFDPVAIGVVVVVAVLALAIVKPWDVGEAGVAVVPTQAATPAADASSGPDSSAVSSRGALVPPTWSDVRSVITPRADWGIRTIVLGAEPDASPALSPEGSPVPARYAERWFATEVDGDEAPMVIADEFDGQILALGLTFPPTETPLDVRIWQDHEGGELEWMDARPVNDVPARGAYLFLRRGVAGAAVRAWAPGRYRMDVLVGDGIRRIDVLIRDRTGRLPDPDPWPVVTAPSAALDAARLEGRSTGLFVQAGGVIEPLRAVGADPLDEAAAWLDVDPEPGAAAARSLVARTYQPQATHLGVVLPAFSSVRSADIVRLAPVPVSTRLAYWTGIESMSTISFVAFGPLDGTAWRPGVYALSIAWVDLDGSHDRTWNVELRPGPLPATPLLLSATRAWSTYVGDSGALLGVTAPLSGTDPFGVRLLEIAPQTEPGYPGLAGSNTIGCGPAAVVGHPEVIGIVGHADALLTPVASRILHPLADSDPMEVLTAAGAVPGLTLVSPVLTAEFGGPASYWVPGRNGRGGAALHDLHRARRGLIAVVG